MGHQLLSHPPQQERCFPQAEEERHFLKAEEPEERHFPVFASALTQAHWQLGT